MFDELKSYAKEYHVPIIQDGGLEFLLSCVQKYNVKSCLEIGTAIGYSALCMSTLNVKVTSLERNIEMYDIACKNKNTYDSNDLLNLVYTDALEYTPTEKFDMIFIDAAKAQNIKFFERFSPYLNEKGIVIVDNLNFHGVKETDENISRNLRQMIKKINMFKEWIIAKDGYQTTFHNVGDGMSISIKE